MESQAYPVPDHKPARLWWLESCRGIAASLVVLFHASGIMARDKYFGVEPLGGAFGFGYAGVDFFFVLSGFIILFVHFNDINRPSRAWIYLKKRMIRIYPLHWIVTIMFLVGMWLHPPDWAPDVSLDKIVRSFLLLPQEGYPLGVVAWTLIHEMAFYLVFFLLILQRKLGIAIFGIWWAGVLPAHLFGWADVNYLSRFLFSFHNLEFMLGMVVAWVIIVRNIKMRWRESLTVGIALFLLVAASSVLWGKEGSGILLPGYAIASALIIYGLAVGEAEGFLPYPPRMLVFLGKASYSIYLIHFLALSVLIKVFMAVRVGMFIPYEIMYFLMVILAISIGCLLHVFVEAPLLTYLRKSFVYRSR